MEHVLEVYKQPYDPRFSVVCMDEQPKQLIRERCLAAKPGKAARVDYQYVREGVCEVWMFVEPLGAWRDVRVSARSRAPGPLMGGRPQLQTEGGPMASHNRRRKNRTPDGLSEGDRMTLY
jgi:hypothetical protein